MEIKYSPLRDKIDVAFLERVLKDLESETEFTGHVVDLEHNFITKPHWPFKLCQLIRSSAIGFERCDECDLKAISEAIATSKPVVYECHGLLTNIAIPLRITGEPVVFLVGQYIRPEEFDEDYYIKLAGELGLNSKALVSAAKKLQVQAIHTSGEETAYTIAYLLTNLFERTALNLITEALNQTLELGEVLGLIAERARDLIGTEASAIVLVEEDERRLNVVATTGLSPRFQREYNPKIADTIAERWAMEKGKPYVVFDMNRVKAIIPDILRTEGIKSFICTPLIRDNREIGFLYVANSYPWLFSSKQTHTRKQVRRQAHLLDALASQAAVAITNAQLYQNTIRTFETFEQVDKAITSGASLNLILDLILGFGLGLIQAPVGWLAIVDEERKCLDVAVERGFPAKWSIEIGKGVTGRVAKEGKPLNIGDVRVLGAEEYVKCIEDTLSQLAVPLIVDERVIGVLNVESPKLNAFTDNDEKLLLALAHRAAVAYQKAQMFRESQAESKRLGSLYTVAKKVGLEHDLDDLLQSMVNEIAGMVGAESCSVFLRNDDPDTIVLRASVTLSEGIGKYSYKRGEPHLTSWVFTNGESLNIKDVFDAEELKEQTPGLQRKPHRHKYREAVSLDAKAALFVPLKIVEECEGVIRLEKKTEFTPEEQELIEAFADEIAIIVQNAQLIKRLQEEDEAKAELIQTLAHELKTPITSMITFCEILLDSNLSDQQKHFVRLIKQDSERYGRLVQKALSFSWIEAGKMKPNIQEMSLQKVAQHCISIFAEVAKEKNIKLEMKDNVQDAIISADRDLIIEVMMNLLGNALKFTPKGGEVALELNDEDEHFLVNVMDTGTGISEEAQKYVFDKFYQGDPVAYPGAVSGSGLGLTIAKYIVEAHSGMISVKSKLSEGSTFSFILPKKREANDTTNENSGS